MKLLSKLKAKSLKYLRYSPFSGFLFRNKAVILKDNYGMRFVLYPHAHEPLEKLLTRRHLVGEYAAISRILKPGDVALDVGANIGTHSVYMSKIVGKNGKLYSFEPVPETSWFLKENLVLNRIENTEVITAALSDQDGSLSMNIFPVDFSEWNSFGVPDTKESSPINKIDVQTLRLDSFIKNKNISRINFLKIDAEGSEKKVLDGSSNALKQGLIDVLSFEVSEIPLRGAGGSAVELFEILNKNEYSVYTFDYKAKKFVGPVFDSKSHYEMYYASKKDLRNL
jgi:FkbM family methyltransferase